MRRRRRAVKVIVNGDDFGHDMGCNRGVLETFQGGVLTSASLLSVGRRYKHALKIARENRLPIGAHIALSCEKFGPSMGPLTGAKELIEKHGRFPRDPTLVPVEAYKAVEKEVLAQIDRLLQDGLKVRHIDGHMYCLQQKDGRFKDILNRVWGKYKIPFVSFRKNWPMPRLAKNHMIYGGKGIGGSGYQGRWNRFKRRLCAADFPFKWIQVHVSTDKHGGAYRYHMYKILLDPMTKKYYGELRLKPWPQKHGSLKKRYY